MKEGVPVTISKKSMKWIPWLLVLPVVIIRGFTTLYPILMTVRNSFFDIKILSGINEFCGIQNYLKIFSRSQSAYIYTFYSDFCSSINDIPCNIRRRSCSDIKYEI